MIDTATILHAILWIAIAFNIVSLAIGFRSQRRMDKTFKMLLERMRRDCEDASILLALIVEHADEPTRNIIWEEFQHRAQYRQAALGDDDE